MFSTNFSFLLITSLAANRTFFEKSKMAGNMAALF